MPIPARAISASRIGVWLTPNRSASSWVTRCCPARSRPENTSPRRDWTRAAAVAAAGFRGCSQGRIGRAKVRGGTVRRGSIYGDVNSIEAVKLCQPECRPDGPAAGTYLGSNPLAPPMIVKAPAPCKVAKTGPHPVLAPHTTIIRLPPLRSTHSPCVQVPPPGLALESLERRDTPDGKVTAAVAGGVLTLTGDDLDNSIQVEQTGPGAFTVSGVNTTVQGGPNFTGVSHRRRLRRWQ